MKNLTLLLLITTEVAFSQANYYIQNNSSSVTILPNQISSQRLDAPGGEFNTALGQDALKSNIRDFNTAVGYRALYNNAIAASLSTDGINNTGIGVYALYSNTNGYNNIALGFSSLYSNTTGDWNVAMGNNALYENIGGLSNVAIGFESISKATSVNYNTGIGAYSMRYLTGGFNTALGANALAGSGISTSNGTLNVAVGYAASQGNTSGSNNVAVGYQALTSNASGSGNVAIGYAAGYSETGSNKLYINNSSGSTPLIGGDFSDNKVGINRSMANLDARTETLQVQGGGYFSGAVCASNVSCPSDLRYKRNISTLQNSLQKLLCLRGVNYHWRIQEFPEQEFGAQQQTGFIAQELEQIYPEMVITDAKGFKSVDYARLTPVLVEAIKDLHNKLAVLERGHKALKEENTAFRKQTETFEVRLQSLEKETLK